MTPGTAKVSMGAGHRVENRRGSVNYFLLVTFICLNLIAPALVIVWGVGRFSPFSRVLWLRGATNIGLLFFIFPVSLTYLILSLRRVFPGKNGRALLYFMPYLGNFGLYAMKFGLSEGFFSIWALHSLPLFLGYMFCLIAGFIWLIGRGLRDLMKNTIREIVLAALLILFLAGTFTFAWISIFLTGLNLQRHLFPRTSPGGAILFFLASISLVIGFHFPLLRTLYREGRL